MTSLAEITETIRSGSSVSVIGHSTRTPPTSGLSPDVWVTAPSGIEDFQPDEMTIRCGAGTTIDELGATLRERGQFANLCDTGTGTVGGALSAGRSGLRRLGRGSMRDTLLEVRFVDHRARLLKAGGPTVKNVSGFDLCRLFVGSWGAFGVAYEVTLRTRPVAAVERWFSTEVDDAVAVAEIQQSFFRPSSILWNGREAWLCLEGHPMDVDEQISTSRHRWEPTLGPPSVLGLHRRSVRPVDVAAIVVAAQGSAIGEMGVGVVHHPDIAPPGVDQPSRQAIVERLLTSFNPERRINRHIDFTHL
jgi:glycolate oxidase FAD binding subunit